MDSKPTRTDYLNGGCSFEEYYAAICADGGVSLSSTSPFIVEVRKALAAGDEHLNTIPLQRWDSLVPHPITSALGNAFRTRGDYPTAAGLVCTYKTAALLAAQAGAE